MEFHYISPSVLPSRTANSVHVVRQCEGLLRHGVELTLYAKRNISDKSQLVSSLLEAYGLDFSTSRLVTYQSRFSKAENIFIALMALVYLYRSSWPEFILSRNLYASYVISVLKRKPLLYETHYLEYGLRGKMQRAIMTRPWVTTIVISQKLIECLEEHHGVAPRRSIVLHDAAPAGIEPLASRHKRSVLRELAPAAAGPWPLICGYFGHLHPGRGIEVIADVARSRPQYLFLVYGGYDQHIEARRASNTCTNLRYMGYVPHTTAQKIMSSVDVLLMPYQESVSIGIAGHDTARWMSPMKMFEYLASGTPIVSSNLPVLREVLEDGVNSVLVPPADASAWAVTLDKLAANQDCAQSLGLRGHVTYRDSHTWTRRAKRLLAAVEAV